MFELEDENIEEATGTTLEKQLKGIQRKIDLIKVFKELSDSKTILEWTEGEATDAHKIAAKKIAEFCDKTAKSIENEQEGGALEKQESPSARYSTNLSTEEAVVLKHLAKNLMENAGKQSSIIQSVTPDSPAKTALTQGGKAKIILTGNVMPSTVASQVSAYDEVQILAIDQNNGIAHVGHFRTKIRFHIPLEDLETTN